MGILSKYLPDTHLNLPIKPQKSYFRNLIRHYASFFENFFHKDSQGYTLLSCKISEYLDYWNRSYGQFSVFGAQTIPDISFRRFTLLLSSFLIARESSKNKAPQAIKDITTTSMARNLSFSLLQLGLATLTSTAGQGQRLGPVVMVKFHLNLYMIQSGAKCRQF